VTSSDRKWQRWLAVAALVAAAGVFSFLNSGERVTVNVGVATLYRISLVGLVFGAFLLGMVAMFLFGLRYDRRVREVLRQQSLRQPSLTDHANVVATSASLEPEALGSPLGPVIPTAHEDDATELLPPNFPPQPSRHAYPNEERASGSFLGGHDEYDQPAALPPRTPGEPPP
jgi:hypothetical protein